MTIAIILNIILILLEIYALWREHQKHPQNQFIYYTNLSNLLALIAGIVFVLYPQTQAGKGLQFTAAVCLTVTLITVLTVLGPQLGYRKMLLRNPICILHLIAPVLSLIILIFFERSVRLDPVWIWAAPALTLLYGIIAVIMNALHHWDGPYRFLKIYDQTVWESLFWLVAFIGGSCGLSWLLHSIC